MKRSILLVTVCCALGCLDATDEPLEEPSWVLQESKARCTPGSEPERCALLECLEFKLEVGRFRMFNNCGQDIFVHYDADVFDQLDPSDLETIGERRAPYRWELPDGTPVSIVYADEFWSSPSPEPSRVPPGGVYGMNLPTPRQCSISSGMVECPVPQSINDYRFVTEEDPRALTLSMVLPLPSLSPDAQRADYGSCHRMCAPDGACEERPNFILLDDFARLSLSDWICP